MTTTGIYRTAYYCFHNHCVTVWIAEAHMTRTRISLQRITIPGRVCEVPFFLNRLRSCSKECSRKGCHFHETWHKVVESGWLEMYWDQLSIFPFFNFASRAGLSTNSESIKKCDVIELYSSGMFRSGNRAQHACSTRFSVLFCHSI